jgi:TolB-like protein
LQRTYLTIIAVLVAVILYLAIGARTERPEPSKHTDSPPSSVAVLRFVAIGDADDGDVLAEAISARVAETLSAQGISIVADQVAMPSGESLRAATQRLGTRYVLEGSVSGKDGRLRVSAMLVDAETEAHLWADSYDRNVADLANVAAEIASGVVRGLNH